MFVAREARGHGLGVSRPSDPGGSQSDVYSDLFISSMFGF